MVEKIKLEYEKEELIEFAAKLYAAGILDDFEYSKCINKIYDSIKFNKESS